MKKSLFFLLGLVSCILVSSQTTMNIHQNNGTVIELPLSTIDSITYTISNSGNLAAVSTLPAGNITASSAVCSGNVSNNGGTPVTERGICFNIASNPTTANNKITSGSGNGNFTVNLNSLNSNTIYYVRAYAINSAGISYGNEISFTTISNSGNLATVSTLTAGNITASSAVCSGNVSNNGGTPVTERGICFNIASNPTTANNKIISGSGTGNFTINLNSLDTNTTYYVRAYAINSAGTSYGNEISFTTILNGLSVVKRQRATVTYVGATWCPPCGAYGDPTKEHMESTFGNDVVILSVQSGDAISTAGEFGPNFGNAFQSFVSSNSIPHAYWSSANVAMDHRGFTTSSSANATAADANINAILSNVNVSVGVAASATISGDTVTVETLTKFYSNQGEHYIGVYLLEDSVMANQSISGSPDAITAHNNVIRLSAFQGNLLGSQSIGTSFTANQEVLGSYSIPYFSGWNSSNLQVAVVIWNSTQADGISNSIIVDVN